MKRLWMAASVLLITIWSSSLGAIPWIAGDPVLPVPGIDQSAQWLDHAAEAGSFAEMEQRFPGEPEGQSIEVVLEEPPVLRVPEPSSPWLVLIGLALLGMRSGRRPVVDTPENGFGARKEW